MGNEVGKNTNPDNEPTNVSDDREIREENNKGKDVGNKDGVKGRTTKNPLQKFMKKKKKPRATPLGEFRKRKLTVVFRQFFDLNGNGSLDREDFDVARQNVCRLNGWKPETDVWNEAEQTFTQLWQLLQDCADEDQDGQITVEEWIKMWEIASDKIDPKRLQEAMSGTPPTEQDGERQEDIPSAPSRTHPDTTSGIGDKILSILTSPFHLNALPWLENYIQYKFNLFDRTRDGVIDVEEYEYVLSDFGVPARDARQAFVLMTRNADVKMDFAYFRRLCMQYYFSDDETCLGNFVTGKLRLDEG